MADWAFVMAITAPVDENPAGPVHRIEKGAVPWEIAALKLANEPAQTAFVAGVMEQTGFSFATIAAEQDAEQPLASTMMDV